MNNLEIIKIKKKIKKKILYSKSDFGGEETFFLQKKIKKKRQTFRNIPKFWW